MKPDSDNDPAQAEDVVRQHVKNEGSNLSSVPIGQALVGEGREGGKCSAEASCHKQAPAIMLVIGGPGEHIAHDDAPYGVYD